MRLLVKLAMVNERPDDNGSLSWSDTGDRYILRLFRDFVFHQKDAQGQNVTDLGHVIDALAKLDVGDAEAIPLCSPDGKTILVCTYEDVRRCLENAYGELTSQTTNPLRGGTGDGRACGRTPRVPDDGLRSLCADGRGDRIRRAAAGDGRADVDMKNNQTRNSSCAVFV